MLLLLLLVSGPNESFHRFQFRFETRPAVYDAQVPVKIEYIISANVTFTQHIESDDVEIDDDVLLPPTS